MCFETPDDLEGRGKDPNVAIVTPYKEIVRARADGAKLIALTESAWSGPFDVAEDKTNIEGS